MQINNFMRTFIMCCYVKVVVPSLTPGSYNLYGIGQSKNIVVVPSLTPGSYNALLGTVRARNVVVPSLTPGSYNF